MLLSGPPVAISRFTIVKDVSCPIKDYQIPVLEDKLMELLPNQISSDIPPSEFLTMVGEFTSSINFLGNNAADN
jgi:hypothetical protein